ncbi:penicillin-binding transpeptidase domain-containing protein [Halobacteriovorax sp. JY17]|uniref:penicillin-binding transpeptidase domain-containing protein n=1 Tax=Halobacteriovorax sp. JY17 TaxID=2014617 RepID=UPI0025BA170C|nr:penicillin-binding transpeptidase domain-containing protein [Halobacteriovorax sp. JY17]
MKKEERREEIITTRSLVKENLNEAFKFSKKTFPKKVDLKEEQVDIKYSFNEDLTAYIKKILKRYRSDYSSVIVIDNETGYILSAVGYERKDNQFNITLPFSSTHPSASLFKIVTTADLLEKSEVTKDSVFKFRGRGTTLYKYQLKDKKSRWQRRQSFERAFAYSNNVIFGKAAIKNTTGERLFDMAADFGFNEKLMEEISLSKSVFEMPDTDYELAEKASGFNKKTMISPIHAAVMASVVANDGVLNYPRVVTEISDNVTKKVIWSPQQRTKRVLEVPTARELQELMEVTVKRGTARGSFRRVNRKLLNGLEIGGKTGSITGGIPFGKRDWFTSFAVPVNKNHGKGISIAVMNINLEKWYVKSSYLARKVIEYYYKEVNPLNDNVSTAKEAESDKDT